MLAEGELHLATEDFSGGRRDRVIEQILRAIAAGNTRFAEIKDETECSRACSDVEPVSLAAM